MSLPLLIATSMAINAAGNIYSALQTRKDLKRESMRLEDEANLLIERRNFDSWQAAKQFDELLGQQKVAAAVSGGRFEGSVMNIFDRTNLDKSATITNINETYNAQINQARNAAKQAKKARKGVLIGALLGVGGDVTKTASSFSSLKR